MGRARCRPSSRSKSILGALEREGGRAGWIRRDPERYWFAVFGDPATDEPWMWRVGGHHVAIPVTVADGNLVSSTPSFLGANPAVVPSGPTAGARALDGEETLARELLASLPPRRASGRRRRSRGAAGHPEREQGARRPPAGPEWHPIRRSRAAPSRHGLERLVRHYLGRAPDEVAVAEWERIVDAGLGAITFAWAGPAEPGRGHYYAVRGPRFLIEYDNTQNDANHIHAVWRDLANDWGEDALAAHYRAGHAAG